MQNHHLPPPFLLEGSRKDLGLDSTLEELQLYHFSVEIDCPTVTVTHSFEKYPLVPGVILLEDGKFFGMISRRRLLEYLMYPQGMNFLQQPLAVLYSYARTEILRLSETTPILAAMPQAMRRSPELRSEPIVVQGKDRDVLLDVQELNIASWQIRGIETQVRYERSQSQMIQSDKMANLGRLVDGIAHEILDPVGFIWGNVIHVSNYTEQLLQLIAAYETYCPTIPPEIVQLREEIELDFIQEDLPRSLKSVRAGSERLKNLVTSLQNFCHVDEVYPKPADLHECLDSILLLLKSRLTREIEFSVDYGYLPPVKCFIGQLNQVFITILSNAVDTLLDRAIRQQIVSKQGDKPRIKITTQVCSDRSQSESRWVSIKVADNSSGLSSIEKQQILDSFSPEKRAVKETSLAMSYWIVTAKHGGKLELRSSLEGTEFEIFLPLV